MSYNILRTEYFTSNFKKLAKRHRSLLEDYAVFLNSLEENPLQGVEIAPNMRKIRMAISSKGRGKSGGARVITYNVLLSQEDATIYLLLIYDKSEDESVKTSVIKEIIKELGLE